MCIKTIRQYKYAKKSAKYLSRTKNMSILFLTFVGGFLFASTSQIILSVIHLPKSQYTAAIRVSTTVKAICHDQRRRRSRRSHRSMHEIECTGSGFEQFDGSTCARPRHNSQHFSRPLWPSDHPLAYTSPHEHRHLYPQPRAHSSNPRFAGQGLLHLTFDVRARLMEDLSGWPWALFQFACSFSLSVSMLANLQAVWLSVAFVLDSILMGNDFFIFSYRMTLIYWQLIKLPAVFLLVIDHYMVLLKMPIYNYSYRVVQ